MEIAVAEPKRDRPQVAKEAEAPNGADQQRAGGGVGRQAEGTAEIAREGAQQPTEASDASVRAAARSGTAIAEYAQEISTAWARYAEDIMRHTSEASRRLLRARSLSEVLEVQARLLGDNMQSFLDHSAKFAAAASRMAARPLEATREAGAEQARH
jgi:hypothetical protein